LACTFSCISWEATATLITGLAAVIAAGWIGNKQNKILKKQTAISKQMSLLEEHKIKIDLFDRRMAIYVASREWLEAWKLDQNTPNESAQLAFVKAKDEVGFLFDEKLKHHLDSWWSEAEARRQAIEGAANGIQPENQFEQIDGSKAAMEEALESLPTVFKPYLNIAKL